MSTLNKDSEIINSLGGPRKVAIALGWDEEKGARRVSNWRTRGIPSKVLVDHPLIFLKSKKAA